MAISGTISTAYRGWKYQIVWSAAQSITNNQSVITCKHQLVLSSSYSLNIGSRSNSCSVGGEDKTFTSPKINSSGAKTIDLGTTTHTVKHNSDGTKSATISGTFNVQATLSGVYQGSWTASETVTLDTIPRKSTLSVGNGTLNTAQKLTVTRQATSFTHTIVATCESASTTICTKSTDTSIDFTPPLSWASQNTTGTSVSVTYTITTYNGNTSVGSNSYTKTCTIPSSVKPTVSLNISDSMGYFSKYGAYVQSKSKLKITITASGSYGSTIKKYNTTADGKTYTSASITTDVVSRTGSLTITATVTDSRGRTTSASATVTVLAYSPPKISSQKATRCNSAGVSSSSGDYLAVTFNANITSLNSKNSALYSVEYKKTTESTFTKTTLSNYAGQHSISGGVFIFEADKASSYDIVVTATDDFTNIDARCTGSSIKKLWSWLKKGLGIAFGKIAELENTVEFDMDAKFNNPVYGKALGMDKLPTIPKDSDFNDYITTGCFAVHSNANAESCKNIPVKRAGRLEVWSATGEGVRPEQWSYLRQRYIPYNSSNAVWERDITRGENNVWTFYDWFRSSLDSELSDKIYNKSAITIRLPENYTLSVKQAYTKIPFSASAVSVGNKLSFSSNSVLIGSNIDYVKVNAQIQLKTGTLAGIRHFRIQKLSNGTTTSWAWTNLNSDASVNDGYHITPIIIPVTEGDLIFCVYYTSDTDDYVVAGSATNGLMSYLTVEEL